MCGLLSMRHEIQKHEGTPLQIWLKRHGARSIAKYEELLRVGGVGPISFEGETPSKTFKAYIDPEGKLEDVDRLSQVLKNWEMFSFKSSCIEELRNISF